MNRCAICTAPIDEDEILCNACTLAKHGTEFFFEMDDFLTKAVNEGLYADDANLKEWRDAIDKVLKAGNDERT